MIWLQKDGLSTKRIGEITKKNQSTMLYITERYYNLQMFEDRDRLRRSLERSLKRNTMCKVQDNPYISASQVLTDLMIDYDISHTSNGEKCH